MSVATVSPPEAKKLRTSSDFPTQVVAPHIPIKCEDSPETGGAQESPAGPSSARSSNGSATTHNEEENNIIQTNLLEFISQNILGSMFKMDQMAGMILPDGLPHPPFSAASMVQTPVVPGAVAVAQMPTAQLFAEDDWSWHRNPAASIRSGGTNKQTPVWKYFVYDKSDNLSRCIVGDCTYQLKGPHTSTLACHLKKHPDQYAEFQRLKGEYSRERSVAGGPNGGGGGPSSPASSSSTSSIAPMASHINNNNNNNNNHDHTHVEKEQPQHRPKSENRNSIVSRITPPPSSTTSSNTPMSTPFPFIFPQAVPNANPNLANTLLQQHGMTIGPQGQLMLTKKWKRDERKQREMEHRLSLFISSARLPSSIVNDSTFRELLESAQPKFNCPGDAAHLEQILSAQFARTQMAVRQAVLIARRLSILVDVITVTTTPTPMYHSMLKELTHFSAVSSTLYALSLLENKEIVCAMKRPFYRVAVTASMLTTGHTLEQHLLAVRPLEGTVDGATVDGVQSIVKQVLNEYGAPMEKVTRIVTSGLERDGRSIGGVKTLESYRPRLHSIFTTIIDRSERIDELKKLVYTMIVTLVTQEGLMQSLIKTVGHHINLPLTDTFFTLLEAVLAIKTELVAVLAGAGMEPLNEDQWRLLQVVHSLSKRLSQKTESIETIDTVLPCLMQMLVTIEKDAEILGSIGSELKQELNRLCGSIIDSSDVKMEGDFVVATALNPQLILLLNDEQLAMGKEQLEQMVRDRIRGQEEVVNKKRSLNSLDQLLASVIDRRTSNGNRDEDQVPPPSMLYPDLMQAAQLKKKINDETPENNRFAEAIVQAYFDEATQSDSFSPTASFSNRHIPPPAFWHTNTHRYPQLAEIALELLSVPATTPGVEALFGVKGASFDPLSLLMLPERLERDTLLRFNRHLVPRSF